MWDVFLCTKREPSLCLLIAESNPRHRGGTSYSNSPTVGHVTGFQYLAEVDSAAPPSSTYTQICSQKPAKWVTLTEKTCMYNSDCSCCWAVSPPKDFQWLAILSSMPGCGHWHRLPTVWGNFWLLRNTEIKMVLRVVFSYCPHAWGKLGIFPHAWEPLINPLL